MGKNDKQPVCMGQEAEKSPGNTGLPGEKVGGHQSCTHQIHPRGRGLSLLARGLTWKVCISQKAGVETVI